MRLWWMLLLTTAARASDVLTTTNRTSDVLTTGDRTDFGLTTGIQTSDELTYCDKLEKELNINKGYCNMYVQGHAVPLAVLWDKHAPARAVSALLVALVSRGMKYNSVTLNRTKEQPLAEAVYFNDTRYDGYRSLLAMPAAAQRIGAGAGSASSDSDSICALRVAAVGPGAAPAAVTLLVHLAAAVADDPECKKSNSWIFFKDEAALRSCGFANDSEGATVYYLSEYGNIADELADRAKAYGLRWQFAVLGRDVEPRVRLLQLLRAGNRSFLFVDHEVWSTSPRVATSQPPPCTNTTCPTSLDPVYTVRLASALALDEFLPNVLNVIRKFSPTNREIREILELETDLGVVEENATEAACAWSLKNKERVKSWFVKDVRPTYWIIIFLCESDQDYQEYKRVIQQLDSLSDLNFKFDLFSVPLNCSDEFEMAESTSLILKYRNKQALVGAVGVGEGSKAAAALADSSDLALVLYDSVAEESLGDATRVIGGPVSRLVSAIDWFLSECKWVRLAVISDKSLLARGIYNELSNTKLVLRNKELQSYSDDEIKLYLESFKEDDARIFYVNTDADVAARVLCAAMELKMTHDEGYVWLAREWRPSNRTCGSAEARAAMRHYTVSFWWRGQHTDYNSDPADVNRNVTEKLQNLWPDRTWPMRAAPLADALLLLRRAADSFLSRHPERVSDIHGHGTAQVFWSSINGTTIPGVTRGLTADTDSSAPVYIDEWRDGARPVSVAVYPAAGGVDGVCGGRTDGGKQCLTTRWYKPGEWFVWRCHDGAFLATALALALAVPALLAARRARISRLRRRERMLKARHAARSRRAAAALAGHLVDRGTLELRHELGAGRFGRVRLAVLRAPGRKSTMVAAKALPDDATASEEAEFLKEACTLASLEHEHIVRLVGVCATDGPPLVLMEFAFFGDLSAYLRERRHLAERIDEANEEAEHVSAASLTRLASEAASALAYLATKRLVHRDVRAANCLVDARRALKLADFGLARQTAGAEYACARRGFFPVLWMAPESLERGVFSAASDVWALGVLMFELVTLGERPYGDWSPPRVLRFVLAGGRPPLPPDASIKTIGILTSCWRRAAEQRPSAGAVCAYLRARHAALAPALRPAPAPDTTPDTTPDTAPDATPDTTPDATPDTTPNTAPDTTPDTAPDTTQHSPTRLSLHTFMQ